jgi:DnaJ-class molecular chaperone
MKGYGAPGLKGSAKGDQYVKITIEVPRKLTERQTKLLRQAEEEGL